MYLAHPDTAVDSVWNHYGLIFKNENCWSKLGRAAVATAQCRWGTIAISFVTIAGQVVNGPTVDDMPASELAT